MGLKLLNINKSFGLGITKPRKKILSNVNLEIEDGEMVAIVGKRGSGKTTLMNIMTGLNRPDSGHYMIDGKVVGFGRTFILAQFRAKKCGIITKKPLLVPDLTIFENITMPLNHRFMTRKRKLKRAREVLRGLGLKGKGRFYPTEFSDLDMQKIAAGRAMIAEPKYIFADEPTAILASADVDRYMDFLEVLNRAGYTIVVFTHSKRVAAHCQRMIPITGEDRTPEPKSDVDDFANEAAEPPIEEEPASEEAEIEQDSPELHEILGEEAGIPAKEPAEEPVKLTDLSEFIQEEEPAIEAKPKRKSTGRKKKKTEIEGETDETE